jgi:hypothetical protein
MLMITENGKFMSLTLLMLRCKNRTLDSQNINNLKLSIYKLMYILYVTSPMVALFIHFKAVYIFTNIFLWPVSVLFLIIFNTKI